HQAGREDHDEVDREFRPINGTEVGDLRFDVAAQDVNRQTIARTDADHFGRAGYQADQGRARIVRRPPLAGDDLGAGGWFCRPGYPAVAPEKPGGLRIEVHVLRTHAIDAGNTATEHRNSLHAFNTRMPLNQPVELLQLVGLNVDEIEAGRFFRHLFDDLVTEVALDQRDGDQDRQPKAQGHDDAAGCRPGPVEIGNRQP